MEREKLILVTPKNKNSKNMSKTKKVNSKIKIRI